MKLSIADLTVEIFPAHELLQERVGPYLCDEDRQPDLRFDGVPGHLFMTAKVS